MPASNSIKIFSRSIVAIALILFSLSTLAKSPSADSTSLKKSMPCVAPNPITGDGYTCGPGTVTLTCGAAGSAPVKGAATASPQTGGGGSGAGYYWYDGSGAQVGTGTSFSFYLSSGTATYYAAQLNSSGCWSGKTAATGHVVSIASSNAGSDQSICGSGSVTLGANTPPSGQGTGTWSVSSGPSTSTAQFSNINSATSTFTPAGGYGDYSLKWTIANSPCASTFSFKTVHYYASPTTANAGPAQQGSSTCGSTNVTLSANTPSVGTGAWSLATDSPTRTGYSFGNTTSTTSSFTGTAGGQYDVVWTITNGTCTSISETYITFNRYPTTASAGSNQSICVTGNATLAANAPSIGTGSWSVSGPSTATTQFSSTTNPAATFTPAGGAGTYTLTWTISNSPCPSSASSMTVTVYGLPTASVAGSNQTTCGTNSVTLGANTPAVGTGSWSVTSGSGGSFGNASSPTSSFSGTYGTTYTLQWTISNGPCASSSSTKTVTFYQTPTTANAGLAQTICVNGNDNNMSANTPTVGTGTWSVYNGPSMSVSQFNNVNSPLALFTPKGGTGTYVLTWTISTGPGCSSSSNVNMNVMPVISAPSAGPAQNGTTTCGLTTVTLAGSTPGTGNTGSWSITSGTGGSFGSTSSATSTFSGTAGNTYGLQWSVTNGGCFASATTSVTFTPSTTISNAGTGGNTFCNATTSNVTLGANTPTVGTGAWTVANGVNTSTAQFSSTTDPHAVFTPSPAIGTYTLTWTITSICGPSSSNVSFTFVGPPGTSNAGSDQSICGSGTPTATLAGNSESGNGTWSVFSGPSTLAGQFSNVTNPQAIFTPAGGTGIYKLQWTLNNPPCTATTSSMVNITVVQPPTTANAGSNVSFCGGSNPTTLAANTPSIGTGSWSVSGPSTATSQLSNVSSPTATFTPAGGTGTYVLTWTIANAPCPASASSVTINANPIPPIPAAFSTAPVIINPATNSGQATLYANASDYGAGFTNNWYTVPTGGTATPGTSYTPTVSTSTSFYVSTYNTVTTCESPRQQVWVDVLTNITAPTTVTKFTVRKDGITMDNQLYSIGNSYSDSTLLYLDGLQRVVQRVDKEASVGGYDIVTPIEYDAQGRTSKDYLPYTKYASNHAHTGNYMPDYQTQQANFYNNASKVAHDANPYALANYEQSPLGRLTEQGAPGQAWQTGSGHSQSISYSFNNGATASAGEEVRLFNPDGTSSGFYAVNTLARTQLTDANGHLTITYTDGAGHTLAKKQQLDNTINGVMVNFLETYYVYDYEGHLVYILPPKATAQLKSASWSVNQTFFDTWCFQFTYDHRGRLTQKKTPGQAAMYIAYDNLNRPVLTQTGSLRASNQWQFVKYDASKRPVVSGIYTDNTNTTLAQIQQLVGGLYTAGNAAYPQGSFFETRGTAMHGYTNISFPQNNADGSSLAVQNVSYYDNYDFDNSGSDDFAYAVQNITNEGTQARAIGLATGGKSLVLVTGSTTWIYSYVFYDKYNRPIQVRSNNQLSSTVDNLATASYDPNSRLVTLTKTHHNAGGTNQTDVTQTPVYDAKGRLQQINHQIGTNAMQTVAQYQYNELGQPVMKQLHNNGGTYMQNVDLRYNIRGWLSSINNAQLANDGGVTNTDTNDFFGMELFYNTVESNGLNTNNQNYNGNVSAVKWKGAGDVSGIAGQRSYNFAYDKNDQLLAATYQKYNTAWNADQGLLNEIVAYDHNGNITSLQRNQNQHGLQMNGDVPTVTSSPLTIDNLTYTYASGNQLSKVDDSGTSAGFVDGTSQTTEYSYDTHGNLTQDLNKGISSISYNTLGKVQTVSFSNGNSVLYTYDASGNKLTMASTVGNATITTNYVNGFVYNTVGTTNTLNFFSSPEGRVVKNTSGGYEYQYAITDHQGNTRIVFTSATPTAQAVTATFETVNQVSESGEFDNYGHITAGHASTTPGNSQYLNGGSTGMVGVARSYKVYPGDQLKIEAYGSYNAAGSNSSSLASFAPALLTALGLPTPAAGETGTAASGINTWGGMAAMGYGDGSNDNTDPKAFVNIVLFDNNYNFLDVASAQLKGTSLYYMSQTYTVKEAGYAYLYVSNEQAVQTDVYFDDVTMTYTPTNILQSNEYYPYGLQTSNSWTREKAVTNNFLYDQGNELNTTTAMYDLPFRNYDAALGRMFQVDPMAISSHTLNPYHYAGNNPIGFNDPTGLVRQYWDPSWGPDPHYGGGGMGQGLTVPDWNMNGIPDGSEATYNSINSTFDNVGSGPSMQDFIDAHTTYKVTGTSGFGQDGTSTATYGLVVTSDGTWTNTDDSGMLGDSGWSSSASPGTSSSAGGASSGPTQGGPNDPPKIWYRTAHGGNFDIVWQHQRIQTEFGHIDKVSTVIINYTDTNKNGVWDKDDDWEFEKYGYQVKSYFDDYSGTQPAAQQIYGTLGEKISSSYWDQIYMAVNGHLDCDCYTDWVTIPKLRLQTGAPHR